MFARLKEVEARYQELEQLLSDPAVVGKQGVYQKYAKEHADLSELVDTYREYEKTSRRIEEDQALLKESDEELKELAREELPPLKEALEALEARLRVLLLPQDPNDEKNVFLEIRAGTGGDEAGLFAEDLFRMYARFAENSGWKVEVMSSTPAGGMGGFKEIIALITGKGRLQPDEIRERHPPGPAGADHGGPGAYPYLGGDGGDPAGGGGGGTEHRSQRPPDRCLPFDRSRRPERQHDRFGRPDHPPADGARRHLPG